jgi:hypothetical protein
MPWAVATARRIEFNVPMRKGVMIRNSYSMMSGTVGFQNDVATNLMNTLVAILSTKQISEINPAKVAWNFHAQARTSSRTRCRRI